MLLTLLCSFMIALMIRIMSGACISVAHSQTTTYTNKQNQSKMKFEVGMASVATINSTSIKKTLVM